MDSTEPLFKGQSARRFRHSDTPGSPPASRPGPSRARGGGERRARRIERTTGEDKDRQRGSGSECSVAKDGVCETQLDSIEKQRGDLSLEYCCCTVDEALGWKLFMERLETGLRL